MLNKAGELENAGPLRRRFQRKPRVPQGNPRVVHGSVEPNTVRADIDSSWAGVRHEAGHWAGRAHALGQ